MTVVAITSYNGGNAQRYIEALAQHTQTRTILPESNSASPEVMLEGVGGLLLTGGPGIDPSIYGETKEPGVPLEFCQELDSLEFGLLRYALDQDMPVLAICRGMQLLNVAFGGKLLQHISGHVHVTEEGCNEPIRHSIYLSPGSKLAAILGMGGFFRVNGMHHQGLREAQKSPRLLASAYSLEDAIIEGLESPEHSWVVGVQCRPERQEEVPPAFKNLFLAFAERADGYSNDS